MCRARLRGLFAEIFDSKISNPFFGKWMLFLGYIIIKLSKKSQKNFRCALIFSHILAFLLSELIHIFRQICGELLCWCKTNRKYLLIAFCKLLLRQTQSQSQTGVSARAPKNIQWKKVRKTDRKTQEERKTGRQTGRKKEKLEINRKKDRDRKKNRKKKKKGK